MRIGEIKLIDNKLIKCVKSDESGSCEGCCFDEKNNYNCLRYMNDLGDCSGMNMNEKQFVIFIELKNSEGV